MSDTDTIQPDLFGGGLPACGALAPSPTEDPCSWPANGHERHSWQPPPESYPEAILGQPAFDREAVELARTTDPDTSHVAAATIAGSGTVRAMLRLLLQQFAGGEQLTSEQASLRAELEPEKCSKRTSDLIRLGFLAPTGEQRLGTTGRPQRVLAITGRGREALGTGIS
jgi:hypothetical protein